MNKIPFILRIVIGLVFILSGIHKLLAPIEEFTNIIDTYDVFPASINLIAAYLIPWCELLLGVLLFLGLYLSVAAQSLFVLLCSFAAVITQALIRRLPIEECGCFGGQLSLSLPHTLIFDIIMLVCLLIIIGSPDASSQHSLDKSDTLSN